MICINIFQKEEILSSKNTQTNSYFSCAGPQRNAQQIAFSLWKTNFKIYFSPKWGIKYHYMRINNSLWKKRQHLFYCGYMFLIKLKTILLCTHRIIMNSEIRFGKSWMSMKAIFRNFIEFISRRLREKQEFSGAN